MHWKTNDSTELNTKALYFILNPFNDIWFSKLQIVILDAKPQVIDTTVV